MRDNFANKTTRKLMTQLQQSSFGTRQRAHVLRCTVKGATDDVLFMDAADRSDPIRSIFHAFALALTLEMASVPAARKILRDLADGHHYDEIRSLLAEWRDGRLKIGRA